MHSYLCIHTYARIIRAYVGIHVKCIRSCMSLYWRKERVRRVVGGGAWGSDGASGVRVGARKTRRRRVLPEKVRRSKIVESDFRTVPKSSPPNRTQNRFEFFFPLRLNRLSAAVHITHTLLLLLCASKRPCACVRAHECVCVRLNAYARARETRVCVYACEYVRVCTCVRVCVCVVILCACAPPRRAYACVGARAWESGSVRVRARVRPSTAVYRVPYWYARWCATTRVRESCRWPVFFFLSFNIVLPVVVSTLVRCFRRRRRRSSRRFFFSPPTLSANRVVYRSRRTPFLTTGLPPDDVSRRRRGRHRVSARRRRGHRFLQHVDDGTDATPRPPPVGTFWRHYPCNIAGT